MDRRASAPGRGRPLPGALATPRDLAPLIDHTVLHPGATEAEILQACRDALHHRFAGVCVRGALLGPVVRALAGSDVRAVAVVDFPRGEGSTVARVREVRAWVEAGAGELDVVVALPALREARHAAVLGDLQAVVEAAGAAAVKVILETCLLTPAERAMGCALASAAGAAYVKSSTGFSTAGATAEDVALLRACVGAGMGVKASGGIRTAQAARAMALAGASRIGCSASVAIVEAAGFGPEEGAR